MSNAHATMCDGVIFRLVYICQMWQRPGRPTTGCDGMTWPCMPDMCEVHGLFADYMLSKQFEDVTIWRFYLVRTAVGDAEVPLTLHCLTGLCAYGACTCASMQIMCAPGASCTPSGTIPGTCLALWSAQTAAVCETCM
jgi:hypothetical protein